MLGLLLCPLELLGRLLERFGREVALGECPGCHTTVYASDPHVRYRREVYHAEPCVLIRRGVWLRDLR